MGTGFGLKDIAILFFTNKSLLQKDFISFLFLIKYMTYSITLKKKEIVYV